MVLRSDQLWWQSSGHGEERIKGNRGSVLRSNGMPNGTILEDGCGRVSRRECGMKRLGWMQPCSSQDAVGEVDIQEDTGFGSRAKMGRHVTRHSYMIGSGAQKTNRKTNKKQTNNNNGKKKTALG